ncbi:rhamnogalacturonan acetylesterase [Pseudactinotalea sp.]|uniref:rhamnogalacturonan acetylesterase n=1 Tax=Pseudactinotalea sp. TaxID=1926260 RepID=UPI003B3A5D6B
MTIHLAGDSTVAPGPLDGSGVAGWGAALHLFVDDEVHNEAIGGATTASFREEGRWQRVIDVIEPDELVVIQFGHNDQNEPETLAATGGYSVNLRAFVAEARRAGGVPVVGTSVERRLFADDGALRLSHGPYPAAVRALGAELDVPVIELTGFTRWLYTWLGQEESWRLFGHANPDTGAPDNTHFGAHGARTVAAFVAQQLRVIRGLDDHAEPLGAWFARP